MTDNLNDPFATGDRNHQEMREQVRAVDTITLSVLTNLSITHMAAAAQFARAAGEGERAHAGEPFGDFWDEIQANATACILLSVTALEAYANELFLNRHEVFPDMRPAVMDRIWEQYERESIREKYEFALLLRDGDAFDRGAPTSQNFDVLIRLRNALTHFKPEWSDEADEHARLSRALEHRAVRSPFYQAHEPLFPRAWASHATARWAVRSALAFVEDFEERASLPSRFASSAGRLTT